MAAPINNKFPFDMIKISKKEQEFLTENFGERDYSGSVRVGPAGYYFPSDYVAAAGSIYNLPLRSDDTVVVSFPRSGTTWTQELVWLIMNNLDYQTAKTVHLEKRYPFLEYSSLFYSVASKDITEENRASFKERFKPAAEILAGTPSPRFIKSHMPLSLLPPNLLDDTKVVYVARDPRDVAVSFYHLRSTVMPNSKKVEFKIFWQLFHRNLVEWSPYFAHVKEAWEQRHHPNLLFLFYEELSQDLAACAKKVCTHMGKTYTDEEINGLCEYLSFDNFKKTKTVTLSSLQDRKDEPDFIRKGKVGGWRNYFDEEMTQQADKWIQDNLKDSDFKFPHM